MLINGLGIGVPYGTSGGGSGGSSSILATSSLYLPLKSTIVPTRGSSTPTFTRATAAWDFDNEGKLNLNIPSGCPRFTGARFVRNYMTSTANPSWTYGAGGNLAIVNNNVLGVDGTMSGHTLTKTAGTSQWASTVSANIGAGKSALVSVWLKGSVGGESCILSDGWVTGAPFTITTDWVRYEYLRTSTDGSNPFTLYLAGATGIVYLCQPQVENVSGQSDQTASEYVNVGVLSAPFHGAGVDGCKYFTTNKNGTPIYSSVLKKYLAEPSRVNNCLWSRDFNNTKWAGSNTGADLVVNGTFTVDANWTKTGTATIAAGVATIPAVSRVEQAITTVVGTRYSFKVNVTTASNRMVMRAGTVSGGQDLYDDSAYRTTTGNHTIYFTATTTTSFVIFLVDTGASGSAVIDDATAFETGISVASTTGLDNITNSADRLTATTNDATLLQLLTAATGTRTTSAWIKRISGSGTVSLTRNGGTNWTDITSSLVTDTWVPVEVTSDVGANPTVGLKMGTSGDVIDVDCFQDENGAWRTSPILTTTAAVTRNADVLSYASAFDVTQGTALCSCSSASPVNNGDVYILSGDSNGRLLYINNPNARNETYTYDGTSIAGQTTGSSLNTGTRKRAVRWGGAMRICADSLLGGSSAFDGSMGAATTMYVGSTSGGISQPSGNIGEVHIWTSALTDAQMQQVTT